MKPLLDIRNMHVFSDKERIIRTINRPVFIHLCHGARPEPYLPDAAWWVVHLVVEHLQQQHQGVSEDNEKSSQESHLLHPSPSSIFHINTGSFLLVPTF